MTQPPQALELQYIQKNVKALILKAVHGQQSVCRMIQPPQAMELQVTIYQQQQQRNVNALVLKAVHGQYSVCRMIQTPQATELQQIKQCEPIST